MASKTEGIALLSMYDDEDDNEEVEEREEEPNRLDAIGDQIEPDGIPSNSVASPPLSPPMDSNLKITPQDISSPLPILSDEPAHIKTTKSPNPPPFQLPRSVLASTPVEPVADQRTRSVALAMVDYEHDDVDMSPDAEEGEILGSGRVMQASDGPVFDGIVEERTPPGTVQILTPTSQPEPLQPSDLAEQSKSETAMVIDSVGTDPEIAQIEVAAVVSEEVRKYGLLKCFIPPLTNKCSEELQ